ncbi:MAG: primosomal protein N' [Bacteroidota bacterium]
MTPLLISVALPVPLQQQFTYTVPEPLLSVISIGSAVVVPFGQKILTGIVTGFPTEKPSMALKHVIDIVDLKPLMSTEDLSLADWISDYYNTPLGETVRLFLPTGLSQTSKRRITLNDGVTADASLGTPHRKILSLLTNGSLTLQQLRKQSGIKNLYSVLKELETSGTITIEEVASRKPSTKKEWFFKRLRTSNDEIFRSKKQNELWKVINSKSEEETDVRSFLKDHSASMTQLKSFAQKQLIELYQKEIARRTSYAADEHISKGLMIQPNPKQAESIGQINTAISAGSGQTFMLHGITGSGKTQVYIEAIRHTLSLKKTAIVLIPEISLTPQTVKRFQLHFGDLVVWMHSRMSDGERYDAWQMAQDGRCSIVIGPRSALFAPLKNIGLIIVDEEHESSYKQFDASPRYHARDVAIMRGGLHHSVVVLGSATPSMESYSNALAGKYTLLSLPERADNAVLPPVRIVNMIDERTRLYAAAKLQAKEHGKKAFENLSRSISSALELKIRDRLEKKEGIILLQNRRGFAPFTECTSCGHVEQCEQCNVTMTYHATKKHLRCHYCGTVKPAPTTCSECGGFEFTLNGFGTQRVEQELTGLFPSATILRMDMDTTSRKGSHEKILRQFGEGGADILLGTQMVAKGLDFPRVTLVGVISADTQMMLPDFRSAERTFQLLTQVAGRAGRSTLAGEVVIQTSQPGHYALKHVREHDFLGFYQEEIEFRKAINYPPFSRVIVIEFKGRIERSVEETAVVFGKKLSTHIARESILGPAPAVLSKIKNDFRWQIIIKADKETDKNGTRARFSVARVLNEEQSRASARNVKIIVDVDPTGIL